MSRSVNTDAIATMTMDANEAALAIAGSRYPDTVKPWRELLRGVADAKRTSISQVLLEFLIELQSVGLLDGGSAMWLLAAFHDEALDANL